MKLKENLVAIIIISILYAVILGIAELVDDTEDTPSETVTVTKIVAESEIQRRETVYILNTNTKKIHRETCPSAELISEHNKACTTDYYGALSYGYEPCKRCNP